MQHATNELSTPADASLRWELKLPDAAMAEAEAKLAAKGQEEFAIYEGTKVHAYQMTLSAMTSIFNSYIKLVHFDGELLHIFMRKEFSIGHRMELQRFFDARVWIPDAVLFDMLSTGQARFATRERDGDDVVETVYRGLATYEGPTDYTDVRESLIAADITDLSTCCIVMTVEELEETRYEGASIYDHIVTKFVGGTIREIDTWVFAQEITQDTRLRKQCIGIAERYFASTKSSNTRKKFNGIPPENTKIEVNAQHLESAQAAVKAKPKAKTKRKKK